MSDPTTGERVTVDASALNLLRSAVDQINDYTPAYIRRTCAEAMATARPLPSREAVDMAVDNIRHLAHMDAALIGSSAAAWEANLVKLDDAHAALLALIYGDDAPGGAS